jgi:hypothetical protein
MVIENLLLLKFNKTVSSKTISETKATCCCNHKCRYTDIDK